MSASARGPVSQPTLVTVGQDVPNSSLYAEAVGDLARWRGIHAVMVTPFQADLSVDEGGLRSNVSFLSESPVDAIICLGSEGEF